MSDVLFELRAGCVPTGHDFAPTLHNKSNRPDQRRATDERMVREILARPGI